ncbi:hypothetical protein D3C75_1073750 [compost metagenome]
MYCATTMPFFENRRYRPRTDTPTSLATISGHSSSAQMCSSIKRKVLRNTRSCTSSSASMALRAGRSRLTIASRVASLSCRLKCSCWVDSTIRRWASTAAEDVAGMRWPHLMREKRRLLSTN